MDHLEDPFMSDWDRLEKLPEGTVTSAYLSFEELLDTETVFNHFKDEELQLLWLAVDTGVEAADKDGAYSMVREPVGFPSVPIWHEDDFILDFREEKKGFLGS